MAKTFPLQINNLRFSVNPTSLSISKPVTYQDLPTQSGVIYQVWYDSPEVLTIAGESAGKTAFQELGFLKRNFERTDKVSELFYKTRLYRGFITQMNVEHAIGHINRFTYNITFQLLQGEQFAFEDFSLTRLDIGFVGEGLRKLESKINRKLNQFNQKQFKGRALPTL